MSDTRSWRSLRIEAGERREEVLAALFAAGAQGVHEDGAALVTSFPPETDITPIVDAVKAIAPNASYVEGTTDTTDWSVHWRDKLKAHSLGRLTVAPPWLADGLDPSRTIVIEPGMAFGTGDHPTTRGALRLMQTIITPGLVVADLGAGSAILAIAAARLGASNVFAIEYDSDAISNAEENASRNGVADVVHIFEGDANILLPLVAPVDVIIANIISSVIVELLPAMRAALREGGRAIISGMLVEERDVMLEAIVGDGWRVEQEDVEDAWLTLSIARV